MVRRSVRRPRGGCRPGGCPPSAGGAPTPVGLRGARRQACDGAGQALSDGRQGTQRRRGRVPCSSARSGWRQPRGVEQEREEDRHSEQRTFCPKGRRGFRAGYVRRDFLELLDLCNAHTSGTVAVSSLPGSMTRDRPDRKESMGPRSVQRRGTTARTASTSSSPCRALRTVARARAHVRKGQCGSKVRSRVSLVPQTEGEAWEAAGGEVRREGRAGAHG